MTTTPTFWSDEFLVNTHTNLAQLDPAVTATPDGGFAVIWEETDPAEDPNGDSSIKIQRFDAAGLKTGGEVSITIVDDQIDPDIAARADGGLTFGYTRLISGNPNVAVSNLSPGGAPAGGGFGGTASTNGEVAIARLASGEIATVRVGSGGSLTGVILESDGSFGSSFSVPDTFNANQNDPAVAALANGGFVVAWDDDGDQTLEFRTFDALGNGVSGDIVAATNGGLSLNEPAVAGLANGNFILVWHTSATSGFDTSFTSVYGQIFTPTGSAASGEILINTTIPFSQFAPSVTALHDGGFMVAWTDASGTGSDTSGNAIRAQRFDADFTRIGSEILVNQSTGGSQSIPDIATLADGRVIVTWEDLSGALDPSSSGIVARILDPRDAFIEGTNGDDAIHGRLGDSTLIGLEGHDLLIGMDGDDSISGGAGDDSIEGGGGDDMMSGGSGDDSFLISSGMDSVSGGSGIDLLDFSALDAVVINLALGSFVFDDGESSVTFSSINAVQGSAGNDDITGTDLRDRLIAGNGDDTVRGGLRDDNLFGQGGDDIMLGNEGADRLFGQAGNDVLDGSLGNDVDQLFGGDGADQLLGRQGNDILDGGTGNDKLFGGAGADRYVFRVGDGVDDIVDWQNGIDRVDLREHATLNSFTDVSNIAREAAGNRVFIGNAGDPDIIVLRNMTLAQLDATDFIF